MQEVGDSWLGGVFRVTITTSLLPVLYLAPNVAPPPSRMDEEVGRPRERRVEAECSAHISARLYAAARLLSGTLSGRGIVTCRAVVSARIPFTPPSCVVPFP